MVKLGTEKRPIVARVHTDEKARYVAEKCAENGWHYIIGFEPDKPEDISDRGCPFECGNRYRLWF